MKDKKIVILIILGVAAVLSVIHSEKPVSAGEAPHIKRNAKKTAYKNWGRNPFQPVESGETASGLFLDGIMWQEKTPKAMINETVMGIGDMIGEYRVVDIKRDRVILTDGNEGLVLKLGD